MTRFRILSNGNICCYQLDAQGRRVVPAPDRMCEECQRYYAMQSNYAVQSNYAPPDPYARDLQRIRDERNVVEKDAPVAFERDWKAQRMVELEAEYARGRSV